MILSSSNSRPLDLKYICSTNGWIGFVPVFNLGLLKSLISVSKSDVCRVCVLEMCLADS